MVKAEAVGSGRAAARAVGAFFDELARMGVRHVVVAPGSRSTPLAMVAYELSRRAPERLQVHVDVDERGAAFLALGIGKATGVPACVVCTSGTAVANFYPAVMEAESSRVPLIVLTGDRPARLQGLGAPQTCDQLNAYGSHVAAFRQMPALGAAEADARFARQAALEAFAAACGNEKRGQTLFLIDGDEKGKQGLSLGEGGGAGPSEAAGAGWPGVADGCGASVHFNFPFDEPLTPDLKDPELFVCGRRATADSLCDFADEKDGVFANGSRADAAAAAAEAPHARIVAGRRMLSDDDARAIARLLAGKRALVLAGEGSVRGEADASALLAWAHATAAPVVADPLSNLRGFDDPFVIDNYDNVLARDDWPRPDVVVRFGRWPVSKRATSAIAAARPMQIVVDRRETRDFNVATDLFVACDPWEFVHAMRDASSTAAPRADGSEASLTPAEEASEFAQAWIAANDAERARIEAADATPEGEEGAFMRAVVDLLPDASCLFMASSMAVRALDTFYTKRSKRLRVLCNRGLNGIDGTVSSAVGAAMALGSATLVIGDLAKLHDLNALALQRELVGPPAAASAEALAARDAASAPDASVDEAPRTAPSLTIVLLNNNGGAIFDMLPQQSDDPYFERLFLTPQDVSFADAACAFGVPHQTVSEVGAFRAAYADALGRSGISIVEVRLPSEGVKERYGCYW